MTGFVNRINTANQSIDHNKTLPANLAGKSHCDTVESIKRKQSNVTVMRCLLGKACQGKNREKFK